jgi:hypothetical protein
MSVQGGMASVLQPMSSKMRAPNSQRSCGARGRERLFAMLATVRGCRRSPMLHSAAHGWREAITELKWRKGQAGRNHQTRAVLDLACARGSIGTVDLQKTR